MYAFQKYPWIRLVSIADGDAARDWKIDEHLHLDADTHVGLPAARFYSIFIDFWMLRMSRCVSYGLGNFGLHAARLTGNIMTCSFQHRDETGDASGFCPVDKRVSKFDKERYVRKTPEELAEEHVILKNRLGQKKLHEQALQKDNQKDGVDIDSNDIEVVELNNTKIFDIDFDSNDLEVADRNEGAEFVDPLTEFMDDGAVLPS